MTERRNRELTELDDDAVAALAAVEGAEPAGPVILANGMWANQWNGVWRVTADRDGAAPVGRFIATTLNECREWANHPGHFARPRVDPLSRPPLNPSTSQVTDG